MSDEVDSALADASGIEQEMNRLLDGDGEDEGGKDKGKERQTDDVDDLETPEEPEREEEPEEEEEEEGDEDEPRGKKGKGEPEEEEEDEDDDEFADELEPPVFRELMEENPDIFKKHRELRPILFREHAYSSIFSHPQEAQATVRTVEGYREFESALFNGEHDKTFDAMRRVSEKGYARFVDGFLPALSKLDIESYTRVTAPVLISILNRAKATGEARGDKNVINSVKHLASLIWPSGKGEIPNLPQKPNREDPELVERERQQAERERSFETRVAKEFIVSINSITDKMLRRGVEKGLDDKKLLSPFIRESIIDKTIRDIKELMDEDSRFGRQMQSLFERAKREGYSKEFKTRMIGTYLGRAKQLVNPIRKRYVSQALGRRTEKGDEPPVRRAVGEGAAPGRVNQNLKASQIDWENTSDLDIISGKAKTRKGR